MKDDLGDRMKGYEAAATERRLEAGLPVYARIDGRSFSGFTRSEAREIAMPEFRGVANRVEVIFDGAAPIQAASPLAGGMP